jgi:hypothetical protein
MPAMPESGVRDRGLELAPTLPREHARGIGRARPTRAALAKRHELIDERQCLVVRAALKRRTRLKGANCRVAVRRRFGSTRG